MTYYKILFGDDETFGVAYPVEKIGLFLLPESGPVQDWKPLTLELRDGEFADYLGSELGCRLCSDRLRSILQKHASPDDELQWLPVVVQQGTENRPYSILHFPNSPDVLNKEKTLFAGDTGFVVKAVFLPSALVNHSVFAYPGGGELSLFVSEPVKQAIEAAGCTGMELSVAPVR